MTMNISFVGTPFSFSYYNSLTVNGCGRIALVDTGDHHGSLTGCVTACLLNDIDNNGTKKVDCFGVGCCQAMIPSSMQILNINITRSGNGSAKEKCVNTFLNSKSYRGRVPWGDNDLLRLLRDGSYGTMELMWGIEHKTFKCGVNSKLHPAGWKWNNICV
uniref:Wall-associated receptor kinase domain-containing protein n=1 Tax=Nelumbo nucifera TaxID=4432 RepID=A0A822ZD69_NELNU|nr:TPA_asm: hypothetical protein HUJ06_000690 [Nelumbo nucifera]